MKPGETIKGRFEPERGKTAGFYLLGGEGGRFNPPKVFAEQKLKAISNTDLI